MVNEKTAYGVLHKNISWEMHHISFAKEYPTLAKKEDKIVMYLIDNDYEILDKTLYYVGGETHTGVETYLNLDTCDYHLEEYSWVEHGVWKLKYKIKKKKNA